MTQPPLQLDVVVLAAGKGTRMRSSLPKVLHPLGGKPMLHHVLDQAQAVGAAALHVVVGHKAADVQAATPHAVNWVEQAEQLGTGHAVQQALPSVGDDAVVLILYGDVPLVAEQTLYNAVAVAQAGHLGLVTAHFEDPAQLGRIVRDASGAITAIVEYKDATDEQRSIQEINSGIMALRADHLRHFLSQITPSATTGELYLTDVIELAVNANIAVRDIDVTRPEEVTGVNDRVQLAELERIHQQDIAAELMRGGVTLADPLRLDVRGEVKAGQDCFIDANVVLCGDVTLGSNVTIGAGCVITDSVIGDNATVHPNTVVEGAVLDADCSVGPFARIRPGTELAAGVKIGNFVETKKAKLGKGSKASHLTYLGDTTIGADCNIGAGTVTCNYDGVNKHHTHMGDGVFIGTNSTLVAPINIDTDAFVAAGSTVTTDVPAGDLAVGRGKQRNISGWTRPDQRKKKS